MTVSVSSLMRARSQNRLCHIAVSTQNLEIIRKIMLFYPPSEGTSRYSNSFSMLITSTIDMVYNQKSQLSFTATDTFPAIVLNNLLFYLLSFGSLSFIYDISNGQSFRPKFIQAWATEFITHVRRIFETCWTYSLFSRPCTSPSFISDISFSTHKYIITEFQQVKCGD